MAPAQFGKDPECSVELTREKWGVSESSGGTPLHVPTKQAKFQFRIFRAIRFSSTSGLFLFSLIESIYMFAIEFRTLSHQKFLDNFQSHRHVVF